MTIFIEYIYKDIVDLIISHLSYDCYNNFNNRPINKNEIINYSLVSKYFFKIVQESLSNNINYNNYYILESFIGKSCYDDSSKNNSDSGDIKSYALINNQKFKIFDSLDKYYGEKKGNYEKCIIKISDVETLSKSLPIKVNPNLREYKFDIGAISIDPENDERGLDTLNSIKEDIQGKINCLTIEDTNFESELSPFDKIVTLSPKSIIHQPNDNYCQDTYSHSDYSQLFQLESLESLVIESSDHVELFSINKINNQTTKLKSLSVPILFHDIIKNLDGQNICENGCDYHYGGIYHSTNSNNLEADIEPFIKKLSENSTIRQLKLSNFCNSLDCCSGIDTSLINKYFSSLFQNNSTIESLSLENLDFIDSTFISGLAHNNSITNLSVNLFYTFSKHNSELNQISDKIVSNIFQNLLPINNKIRTLLLSCYSLEGLINIIKQSLLQNQDQQKISLYNLKIEIDAFSVAEGTDGDIKLFFDQIKTVKYLEIEEINVYYKRFKCQYSILNDNIYKYPL